MTPSSDEGRVARFARLLSRRTFLDGVAAVAVGALIPGSPLFRPGSQHGSHADPLRQTELTRTIVYPFEGHTAGHPITVSSEGFTSVEGRGSAVYAATGLITGSTGGALITSSSHLVTASSLYDRAMAPFRIAVPPTREFAVSRFNAAVAGDEQAGLYVTATGHLALRYRGDAIAVSTDTYTDNQVYWFVHTFDRDGAFQEASLYNARGILVEDDLVGESGVKVIVEHRIGILTPTASYTLQLGSITLSDGALIPPRPPDIIAEYYFNGYDAGLSVTAEQEGAAAVVGSGDARYATPGLVGDLTGAPGHVKVTGARALVTNSVDSAFPDDVITTCAVKFAAAPDRPVDILEISNASGVRQSVVTLDPEGKLGILGSNEGFRPSTYTVGDDQVYFLMHQLHSRLGKHSLSIYTVDGRKLDQIRGDCGGDPTTTHLIGALHGGPASYEVRIAHVRITSTEQVIPGGPSLLYRINGGVTSHSAVVAIRAPEAMQARIRIAGRVTSSVDLDRDGRGQIPVNLEGAPVAGTRVPYDVEVTTDVDGNWIVVGSGEIPFMLAPGTTGTRLTLFEGCHASKNGGISSDDVWDEAMTREGIPHGHVKLGDEGYPNPQNDWTVAEHMNAYEQVLRQHPFNADACGRTAVARKFSDHDRLEGNNNFHGRGIATSVRAWKRFWPHHDIPGRPRQCDYEEWIDGRTIFVKPDDRSNYRDDPSDPEGPNKTFLGSWQHARLLSILRSLPDAEDISNVDPVQGAVVAFDMIFYGLVEFFDRKPDAIPNYQNAMNEIGAVAMGKRVTFVCGDTHHLIMDDGTNNPWGITIVSWAGMVRSTGNLNIFRDGVAAQFFYPPRDPVTGRYPSVKSRTYGLLKIIDKGITYSHVAIGREMLSDTTHTITKVWDTPPPLHP